MSRNSGTFRWLALGFGLALGGALAVAPLPLARAQSAPRANFKAAVPAVPASFPLPLVGGGVLVGLALGAGLGWALKKAPLPVAVDRGPGRAFEAAPFPLAVVSSSEHLKRVNAAFAQFLGASDLAGQSLPSFFHPDDLPRLRVGMQSVFDGDRPTFEAQARLFRPDGELLHTRFSVSKEGEARKPSSVLLALQDVTDQVAARQESGGARAAVSALYDVIGGDRTRSLDAKMKALLLMGCAQLELPIGVLGRICDDEQGERLETLFVQSPDRRVRPAMTLRRAELQSGPPSAEAQLLGLETLPHPSVALAGSHIERNDEVAYLGAPVMVEGALFGMLSFAAPQARELPFAGADAQLLQLMAEWVGGEIERENARAALAKQQHDLLMANGKLEAMATHDALTEAKNRRAFNEKLAEEWSRAGRYGTPLSLVMFDVDKFKSYNDTFGHQAGDGVLKLLARTVMGLVRGTDSPFRALRRRRVRADFAQHRCRGRLYSGRAAARAHRARALERARGHGEFWHRQHRREHGVRRGFGRGRRWRALPIQRTRAQPRQRGGRSRQRNRNRQHNRRLSRTAAEPFRLSLQRIGRPQNSAFARSQTCICPAPRLAHA